MKAPAVVTAAAAAFVPFAEPALAGRTSIGSAKPARSAAPSRGGQAARARARHERHLQRHLPKGRPSLRTACPLIGTPLRAAVRHPLCLRHWSCLPPPAWQPLPQDGAPHLSRRCARARRHPKRSVRQGEVAEGTRRPLQGRQWPEDGLNSIALARERWRACTIGGLRALCRVSGDAYPDSIGSREKHETVRVLEAGGLRPEP